MGVHTSKYLYLLTLPWLNDAGYWLLATRPFLPASLGGRGSDDSKGMRVRYVMLPNLQPGYDLLFSFASHSRILTVE